MKTETKFKDVAHLYLGCKLHEINRQENSDYWDDFSGIKIDAYEETEVCAGGIWETIDNFKPILRTLSDITDAECIELCSIINPPPFGLMKEGWHVSTSEETNYKSVQHNHNSYSFDIDLENGDVIQYFNVHIEGHSGNSVEHVIYLLSKRFDLFGLIASGQAIDATTLPENPYKKEAKP